MLTEARIVVIGCGNMGVGDSIPAGRLSWPRRGDAQGHCGGGIDERFDAG